MEEEEEEKTDSITTKHEKINEQREERESHAQNAKNAILTSPGETEIRTACPFVSTMPMLQRHRKGAVSLGNDNDDDDLAETETALFLAFSSNLKNKGS